MQSSGRIAPTSDAQGVKVYIRVRNMNLIEKEQGCGHAVSVDSTDVSLGPKTYQFDGVFDGTATQETVYSTSTASLLDGFFEGYNATVFAYGQTGSGKTYTMGVEHGGIIPQVVDQVFARGKLLDEKMTTLSLKLSYLEIFNEEVYDLLATSPTSLPVRDDIKGGVVVSGLSEHEVKTTEDVIRLMVQGSMRRATAATGMNDTSSRSHAICTLSMHQQPVEESAKFSKFHLVDLAGSERAKKTLTTGDRFKEGIHINQALLTLGKVITSLSDKKNFIPYRESKLTRLLQDSLGGNSKTAMIACVSPADSNYEETTSTLRYAERTRCIQNKAVINKDTGASEIKFLRQQVELLQLQLLQQKTQVQNSMDPEDESLPGLQEELGRVKCELEMLRQAKEKWKYIAQHQKDDTCAIEKAIEMDMQIDIKSMNTSDLATIEKAIGERETIVTLLSAVDETQFGNQLQVLFLKYEDEIQALQTPTKKAFLTAAQQECKRLQKLHEGGQLKISSLQQELSMMKHRKVDLQRKLKEEIGSAEKAKRRQTHAILQLQRKDSKKQIALDRLAHLHSQQTTLLKRKSEELSKLQQNKRLKSTEPMVTTDSIAAAVDEVLQVEMTIYGAKKALGVEMEERTKLAKSIRKALPGAARHKMEQELLDKNLDIRKLQQKLDLVERNHKGASKLSHANVSTCHKTIRYLMEVAVVSKKQSLDLQDAERLLTRTEEKLMEKETKMNEMELEIIRLQAELESRPPKRIKQKKPQVEEVDDEVLSESEEEGEYDDDSDYTEGKSNRVQSVRKEKPSRISVDTSECCLCQGKCATRACACRARSGHCGDKCSCNVRKCVNRNDMESIVLEDPSIPILSVDVFKSPLTRKSSNECTGEKENQNQVSLPVFNATSKQKGLTLSTKAIGMKKLYHNSTTTSIDSESALTARLKTL